MKGSRLHLDLFKVFIDLVETGSFSKTAARNHLTQSAVSQQISFLERHLGKKLINRARPNLLLTEEGKALLNGSRKILRDYQEILDAIAHHTDQISGIVRVETVYSIGLHQLAPYVRSFMREYPRVNLRVEFSRSDRIYTDVLEGKADLGIIAYPWRHPRVAIIPFKQERLILICSPDHPFAERKKVRRRDLQGENFVSFGSDVPTRAAIDRMLGIWGVDVNVVQEFDNIETLKRSVEVGTGISILPEITVHQEVKSGALARVEIAGRPLNRPTGIIRRQGMDPSKAAHEFVRWLCKK